MKLIKRKLMIRYMTYDKNEEAQFQYFIGDMEWKWYIITLNITKEWTYNEFDILVAIQPCCNYKECIKTMTHDEMYDYMINHIHLFIALKTLNKHKSIYTCINKRSLTKECKEIVKAIAPILDTYIKDDIRALYVILNMI